jgi:HK97 gp10 family phage protein
MARNIRIDELADEIMEGLMEYEGLAAETVKGAVKKAGNTVKKEIQNNAPKDTGKYAKSFKVTKRKETANSLEVTVHSKDKYQLAHLLEKGHAKRGGGRVSAQPHIAPAEEKGIRILREEIERGLS